LRMHVQRGTCLRGKAVIPDVTDNTDDGELRRPEVDLLAQRVLSRPVRAGSGLVDDECRPRLAGDEIPAAEHWNSKSVEVSRCDDVGPGTGVDRDHSAGVLYGETVGLATAAERYRLAAAHSHDAGNLPDSPENALAVDHHAVVVSELPIV